MYIRIVLRTFIFMLDEMNPVHFDFFAKCKSVFHSINFLNFVIM